MVRRWLFGMVLVVAGVLVLLNNLGLVDARVTGLWPLLLMVPLAGALLHNLRYGGSWTGTALLVWFLGASTAQLTYNLMVTEFNGRDVLRTGWPILLVGVGMGILFRRPGAGFRRGWKGARLIVGDLRYGRKPWTLDNLDVGMAVGDVDIDLTTAAISPGDHHVSVRGWAGDVDIWVPGDVTVEGRVHAGVGDVRVFDERRSGVGATILVNSPAPEPGPEEKRVILNVDLSAGDIRVRR